MNKVYTLFALILIALNIFAQSPEKISYQAIVRNSENNLVINQQVGMQISILNGTEVNSTIVVYSEIQTPTTNENGLVTFEIGTGTSSDDFSAIDWGNGIFFIKTETDLNGGTDYSITGTSQLLSVPYALYAKKAGNVPDITNLAEQQALEDSIISIRSDIPDVSGIATNEQAIIDTANQIRSNIPDIGGLATKQALIDSTNSVKNLIPDISDLAKQQALEDSVISIRSDIPDVSPFLSEEIDPLFSVSTAYGITQSDTSNWNNKISSESQTLSEVLALGNTGGYLRITNIANPIANQDVATKIYVDILKAQIDALNNLNLESGNYGILIDVEGNSYKTFKFGNQIWMVENLKVTKYADGTNIPFIEDSATWNNTSDDISFKGYGWYNNDIAYKDTFGALYNFGGATDGQIYTSENIQGACPDGWHLPNDEEWQELESFLGIQNSELDIEGYRGTNEGSKIATNAELWDDDVLENDSDFSSTKFNAIPAGSVGFGQYRYVNQLAKWWSSSADTENASFSRGVSYNDKRIYRSGTLNRSGYSIRCIKD